MKIRYRYSVVLVHLLAWTLNFSVPSTYLPISNIIPDVFFFSALHPYASWAVSWAQESQVHRLHFELEACPLLKSFTIYGTRRQKENKKKHRNLSVISPCCSGQDPQYFQRVEWRRLVWVGLKSRLQRWPPLLTGSQSPTWIRWLFC